MPSSLDVEQTAQFNQFLRIIKADCGFLPDEESFQLTNELYARYAAELIITDGKTIILTVYEKPWKGRTDYWHIPGGFANNFGDSSTPGLCNRISGRATELGTNVFVPPNSDLGTYWWKRGEHDNPNARPLSVYTFVKPVGKIVETKTRRIFPFNKLPTPMIGGAHQAFFDNLDVHLAIARCKGFIS